MHFKNIVFAGMLAAAFAPFAAYTFWQLDELDAALEKEDFVQRESAAALASSLKKDLDFAKRLVEVAALSTSVAMSGTPTPSLVLTLDEILRSVGEASPLIENIHIDDSNGKSLIFWPRRNEEGDTNINQDHSGRWHARALASQPGAFLVSPVFEATGAASGPIINFSTPIYTKDGQLAGSLSAALNLLNLERAARERLEGSGFAATLLDPDSGVVFDEAGAFRSLAAAAGSEIEFTAEDGEGRKIHAASAMVPEYGWTVFASRLESERKAKFMDLQNRSIVAVLALFLLTLAASRLVSSLLSSSVEKLSRHVLSGEVEPSESDKVLYSEELAGLQSEYSKIKRGLKEKEDALVVANAGLEAEVKRQTEELRRKNEALSALFAEMAEGFVWIRGGRVILANKMAEKLLAGLDPDDPASDPAAGAALDSIGTPKTVWRGDRALAVLSFALDAADDVGILFRDATAEEKDRLLKENLIGMVAHEMQTPIAALKIEVDTLKKMDMEQSARSVLEELEESAEHMRKIVGDWLDVARIDGGLFKIHPSAVQLPLLVRKAARRVASRYPDQKVEMRFDEEAECIMADRDRVLQLLENMLVNAARYAREGVSSRVVVEGESMGEYVRLKITDNGIGIRKENLERIFDRFFQVDSGNKRRSGGTGLGLVIAKAIAEAHAGSISVESEPGSGTTFEIVLKKRGA